MNFYNFSIDERSEVLLNRTKTALGLTEVSKEQEKILKKLMIFHPGMLKTGKMRKEGGETEVSGTPEYIELVKKFIGIGIPEDKKTAAKTEAAKAFTDMWTKLFRGFDEVKTPDDLMKGSGWKS